MTATVEVKWWWIRVNTWRLINWTHYLLQGRRYVVELVERGTGAHYPKLKKIEANPEAFGRTPESPLRVGRPFRALEQQHWQPVRGQPGGHIVWFVAVLRRPLGRALAITVTSQPEELIAGMRPRPTRDVTFYNDFVEHLNLPLACD